MWSRGPFRETEEYKARYAERMHGRHGIGDEPDLVCLSYTHDADYGEHRAYPHGRAANPAAQLCAERDRVRGLEMQLI